MLTLERPRKLSANGLPRQTRNRMSGATADALNNQFQALPAIGRTYGRRYGSKKVLRIFTEDKVQVVEYSDFNGVKNTEALVMFNRWAQRNQIALT